MVAMKQPCMCMTGILKEYDNLREQGEGGAENRAEFWDVVVLTTSDAAQQEVYHLEITNKLRQNELPTCASYHVVHDPPGLKIGSGGSTMYTLSKLIDLEPQWRTKKVLLMHAGGSSQRLPSASVLGKAFTAIPIGSKMYTMFDVKLALCMPFVHKLPPGVFICCPDTFETFTFGNNDEWKLDTTKGFVALAHPSPIKIGTSHGVYILEERDPNLDTEVLQCKKVLQKPSEQLMRSEGAIIQAQEVADVSRSGPKNQEWVFTDSNFFFDHSVSEKLVQFYNENQPLSGEICAYGDFLQPLGSHADNSYVTNCKNIMHMTTSTMPTRKKVYDLLSQTPLAVIALKKSKFYHIGTLVEYIDNFCSNEDLKEELGLSSFCFSATLNSKCNFTEGCVIHSLVTSACKFSPRSVVEYCKFTNGAVYVSNTCVISNCEYGEADKITIPENTFMQTVPVLDPNGESKYVTLMFSINDDMKAKASSLNDVSNISYFDRSLTTLHDSSHHTGLLFGEGNPYTLWNAKLFELSDTAPQSFLLAYTNLKKLISHDKRSIDKSECCADASNDPWAQSSEAHHAHQQCSHPTYLSQPAYSFADVIQFKDAKRMIEERNCLGSLIKQALM